MIEWFSKNDWVGHIAEALIMAAIVALLSVTTVPLKYAALAGIMFAIGHFHGREKRDYEVSVKMKPPHLEAYKVWLWSFDQLTDFFPVLGVLGGLWAAIYWLS